MLKPLSRDDTLDTDALMEARYFILDAALQRLESVCDPDAIRRAAVRLSTVLHSHYELEQDPTSFFVETQELGIYHQLDLIRLRREHGPILLSLKELAQAAGETTTALRPRALRIIGQIRDHEAREGFRSSAQKLC